MKVIFSSNAGVNLADADIDEVDEVDEESQTTTTPPQLLGSSYTTCSLYNFVQHVVWPAETCAMLEHAAETRSLLEHATPSVASR